MSWLKVPSFSYSWQKLLLSIILGLWLVYQVVFSTSSHFSSCCIGRNHGVECWGSVTVSLNCSLLSIFLLLSPLTWWGGGGAGCCGATNLLPHGQSQCMFISLSLFLLLYHIMCSQECVWKITSSQVYHGFPLLSLSPYQTPSPLSSLLFPSLAMILAVTIKVHNIFISTSITYSSTTRNAVTTFCGYSLGVSNSWIISVTYRLRGHHEPALTVHMNPTTSSAVNRISWYQQSMKSTLTIFTLWSCIQFNVWF